MTESINFNEVVLVNTNDDVIGTMEKMEAHLTGNLHRAFSVFIFNDKGEMLIQKRADSKYHSAGLWSNACCSHPVLKEKIEDAAKRRLKEELHLEIETNFIFSFQYKTIFDNGLIENELDHVLIGFSNSRGCINREEVSALKFISMNDLAEEMNVNPTRFSEWFKIIVLEHWNKISPILENRKLQTA